ncbi:outer membrane protein 12 [Anaplasma centrale str. Israel]|uniref:Outer membrane protein 12 n=1 Tax=Anaplasma centrale (strain Israel) TaxID=574556 RepID=D1ATG0_ANACI|nr:P44/Msp2 family outer membrane protein [Anaplasma centrale]ACZ48838.1 outer membrane protein 12 [Anaplasma centrale str. Israel]
MGSITRATKKGGVVVRVWVFIAILLFPLQALSASDGLLRKSKHRRTYFVGAYKSSFPDLGNLGVNEAQLFVPGVTTAARMSMNGSVTADINNHKAFGMYRPPFYSSDYLEFAGSVGYSTGPVRLELERFSSVFETKGGVGSVNKDDACNIALVRTRTIMPGNYVVVENKRIGISSIALNLCYERAQIGAALGYVCVGVSGNKLNLLNTSNVTHGYQGKLGIGIPVAQDMTLFAGTYYHMLHGDRFGPIALVVPGGFNITPKPAAAEADMRIAHFGGEFGVRYAF